MNANPPPEPAPESNAALWLAIGRLQSDVARVIEEQAELRTELRTGLAETNRRIDRLFYAVLGAGAGIIASLVALLLRSG